MRREKRRSRLIVVGACRSANVRYDTTSVYSPPFPPIGTATNIFNHTRYENNECCVVVCMHDKRRRHIVIITSVFCVWLNMHAQHKIIYACKSFGCVVFVFWISKLDRWFLNNSFRAHCNIDIMFLINYVLFDFNSYNFIIIIIYWDNGLQNFFFSETC